MRGWRSQPAMLDERQPTFDRDLLAVAQLQTAQLASEATLIKLRAAQRTNRVQLVQALGGSFDAQPPTTTATMR